MDAIILEKPGELKRIKKERPGESAEGQILLAN